MILTMLACDHCGADGKTRHRTNLPTKYPIEAPPPGAFIHVIVRRPERGGDHEVHWHLCSEACYAKWATDQAKVPFPPVQDKSIPEEAKR